MKIRFFKKKVTDKNKHIEPTKICWGCGKDMYNGKNICSDECADVVDMQYAGYEMELVELNF